MYPFFLVDKDGKRILFAVDKAFEASLGKTILHINDAPIIAVFQSFSKTLSFDNEVRMRAQLPGFIRYYSLWENNPYKTDDGSLKLTFTDGSSIVLQAVSPAEIDLAQIQPNGGQDVKTIRKKTKMPFQYTMLPGRKICYLQFNSCVDRESMRSQYTMMGLDREAIDKAVAAIPDFKEFLDEMFAAIRADGIGTLVVDVRGNGGGNSMLCEELLGRLKRSSQIKNGTVSFRISGLWEQNYPQLAARYKQNATADVPYTLGKLYDNSEGNVLTGSGEARNVDDNSDVFNGKVVFIQDYETYSSAGMLITNAVDNGVGTVIGSEGSYNPCGFGDMLTWRLPNTGVSGTVSHKIFYRPDTSRFHEKMLKPDVDVFAYSMLLSGNDDCWEWVLNNVSE